MTTFRKLPITSANANTTPMKSGADSVNSSGMKSLRQAWSKPIRKRRSEDTPNAVSRKMCCFLNHRTQLEDRQIHRNNESTNENAENGHDHGLEQAGKIVYGIVDIFFIEIRNLGGHLVQRA